MPAFLGDLSRIARVGGAVMLALGVWSCASSLSAPRSKDGVEVMVSAANPLAVDAGLAVLAKGGSAIDAAVAVQAVLGLVEPESSGIGGGAFILYFDAQTGAVSAYDGRERAPMAAGSDLFLTPDGEPMTFLEAIASGRAIGVPGAVDALALAHADHGVHGWETLFDDGVRLAELGFPVTEKLHKILVLFDERGLNSPDMTAYFYRDGAPVAPGSVLTNPAYAQTLQAIAANPRALHEGPLADDIVNVVASAPLPGAMTRADLSGYRARRLEPICRDYREIYVVCAMPPPTSGGVAVHMILALVERTGFEPGGADNPENWRRFLEAQRLAYIDRDQYLADTDYVEVPVEGLLAPAYLDARGGLIGAQGAAASVSPGDPWAYQADEPRATGADGTRDRPGTSHFVVVDARGNVASVTTTVQSGFGSTRMTGGFLLNNQLTDFSFAPVDDAGRPIANRAEGGKRPRSSMSPTIVLSKDEGEFVLATGSAGGSQIIAYTAKTLVGILDWELSAQGAVDLPNVVARKGVVRVESARAPYWMSDVFTKMGFTVVESGGENSGLHVIRRAPDGTLQGGADPRREGVARAAVVELEPVDAP